MILELLLHLFFQVFESTDDLEAGIEESVKATTEGC